MKRKLFLAIILLAVTAAKLYSQCVGTQLNWQNPSFEGTPATPHVTPSLWDICQPGVTPDTQPGCWGVTLAPSNGSSYIGMCNQTSGDWHEGAGQQLSSPMVAGTTYTFTIDLATSNSTDGGLTPGCIEIQVWGNMGGNSGCDMSYLCWSSGNITNLTWQTFTVSFTATQNWTNLLFMSNNLGCSDCPYVMMDNLTPVQPIADIPQYTWTNVCQGSTMQFTDASTSIGSITSWNWDYGDGSPPGTTQNPSHTYSAPGIYNVNLTVTSTVPCTTNVTHQVTVNSLPAVNISPVTQSVCAGSNATLTASNASTYQWSSGDSGSPITVSPSVNTTYTVTGTDANGCTGTASCTVTINSNLVPVITTSNATCGLSNGSATVTQSGWNYTWSNSQVTQTCSNIPAGTYTVTVTDGSGCSGTGSCVVSNNSGGSITATSTDENCGLSNGTASSTPVGGTAPYTYLWSNSQTSQNITNLSAGTYTVTVTDANGCTAASAPVTVTNIPGGSVSAISTDENCGHSNGTASSTTNGGVAPFTYLWSNSQTSQNITNLPAGTYTVTATDANGCTAASSPVTVTNIPGGTVSASSTNENCGHSNGTASATPNGGVAPFTYLWSNSQTSQNISNLPQGTYDVTVTDANGCTANTSTTVTNLAGPSLQVLNTINEICSSGNGLATVNAISGLPPYSYLWSNGDNTATATNLHAGTFTCTVTDANNCTAFNSVTITDTPGPTVIAGGITQASCGMSDGSATLNINGGLAPYTYVWNSSPQQFGQNLQNVPTGNYCVTVTDANSCSATTCVTVGEENGPSATVVSENEICDQANGTATVNATGGLGSYTYLWNDGQTTATATGLTQGSYTVTVSDAGCSTVEMVNVLETQGPDAGFSAHPKVLTIMDGPVSFLDNSSGNIENWNWIFGDGSSGTGEETEHSFSNIGTYVVTLIVTDNNGCLDTAVDTIKVKDIFTFYIPNAFTPNADGTNDYFTPMGVSVDPNNFEMTIFDRWGNLVYQTIEWNETLNQALQPWNGTIDNKGKYSDAIMDIYVYRIKIKETDGPNHEYIGRVSLIP